MPEETAKLWCVFFVCLLTWLIYVFTGKYIDPSIPLHGCLLSEKILDHNILTISNIATPLISTYEAISRTDSSQCTLAKLSFLLHQRQVYRA